MKIKNIRSIKKLPALIVAINLCLMQYTLPPYIYEEEFALENNNFDNEENTPTRKLSKKIM